ncbi:MAG: monovalent cation/H(+) antiporter subunit G [Agathobacter sp.]|nr:monovalent cation/H(+) antiporter subunit G [Agathobacter sp.]
MEMLRFILGIAFIIMGLLVFVIQLIGVFKFKYVLNRMHAAGMGDTMGISLCLLGTMFLYGWGFTTLKVVLIAAFLWLASPVSSHLIARLEVTTNEELEKNCKVEKEEEEA